MENLIGIILVYFLPILLGTILLIFWRTMTEHDTRFPTRFHILLYFILSFIPGFGLLFFVIIVGFYIGLRVSDCINIKPNKFTKFWFDEKINNKIK